MLSGSQRRECRGRRSNQKSRVIAGFWVWLIGRTVGLQEKTVKIRKVSADGRSILTGVRETEGGSNALRSRCSEAS